MGGARSSVSSKKRKQSDITSFFTLSPHLHHQQQQIEEEEKEEREEEESKESETHLDHRASWEEECDPCFSNKGTPVTYKRCAPKRPSSELSLNDRSEKKPIQIPEDDNRRGFGGATCPKITKLCPSRKRVSCSGSAQGQYFLDLGQSDFSYTTCNLCGLFFARGHEKDEKIHAIFHKNHLCGIKFKGWQNERIACKINEKGDRIIIVLPSDPSQNQNKVKEVVTMMEKELGLASSWFLNSRSKVYLYIASCKVAGCAIAEPIEEAYPVLLDKATENKEKEEKIIVSGGPGISNHNAREELRQRASHVKDVERVMVLGNIRFQREACQRRERREPEMMHDDGKAINCSNEPVPAVCGIRGIWVSHSYRRRGIATALLDAIRKNFCFGFVLRPSQCAFSQPTLAGIAFALNYCGDDPFLVYK